jgi:hypothetical protein
MLVAVLASSAAEPVAGAAPTEDEAAFAIPSVTTWFGPVREWSSAVTT